ncbi:MAG: phosphoribosyltransferase [Candidatus Synoicihabitans palmerolidicus]|nr:phosphoribosyltransferase [Candidatus Synoicihabitans palmerolidicus]
MELPQHLELLHDGPAIDDALSRLAVTMDQWTEGAEARTGKMLLALCVLRGGVFFFSELLLHMKRSVEPAFCRACAYAKTKNGAPLDKMFVDWQGLDPVGREVMLVDHICDSGRTLLHVDAWLRMQGVRRVRSVTLMHRLRDDAVTQSEITGYTYPGDEWLVGYGMRDATAQSMNTRWIARMKPQPTPSA